MSFCGILFSRMELAADIMTHIVLEIKRLLSITDTKLSSNV